MAKTEKVHIGPSGKPHDMKKAFEQGGANKPSPNLPPRPPSKTTKKKAKK
jgi:hypothetical protein